jgi:hypothetical protein
MHKGTPGQVILVIPRMAKYPWPRTCYFLTLGTHSYYLGRYSFNSIT